jgi:hypothetical protein
MSAKPPDSGCGHARRRWVAPCGLTPTRFGPQATAPFPLARRRALFTREVLQGPLAVANQAKLMRTDFAMVRDCCFWSLFRESCATFDPYSP